MTTCSWDPAPAVPIITSDSVHVWCAALDQPATNVLKWETILADDERRRAADFRRERERSRFVVGRALLRIILGRYLDVDPVELQFGYGQRGKPLLADSGTHSALRFNVSHSQGLALYAVTREHELGVDIEYARSIAKMEHIARRFFSPHENQALFALPSDQRHEAFFNCWTRKEAYIKAIGLGLAQPLDRFDVSLAPGEPASILSIDGDQLMAAAWSLYALTPAPGYTGALAVQANGLELRCWRWQE